MNPAYVAGFFDGEGSIGIYTNGAGTGRTLRVGPGIWAHQVVPMWFLWLIAVSATTTVLGGAIWSVLGG